MTYCCNIPCVNDAFIKAFILASLGIGRHTCSDVARKFKQCQLLSVANPQWCEYEQTLHMSHMRYTLILCVLILSANFPSHLTLCLKNKMALHPIGEGKCSAPSKINNNRKMESYWNVILLQKSIILFPVRGAPLDIQGGQVLGEWFCYFFGGKGIGFLSLPRVDFFLIAKLLVLLVFTSMPPLWISNGALLTVLAWHDCMKKYLHLEFFFQV